VRVPESLRKKFAPESEGLRPGIERAQVGKDRISVGQRKEDGCDAIRESNTENFQ
jgi:hypothetical protein